MKLGVPDCRPKDVGVQADIIAELELGDIERVAFDQIPHVMARILSSQTAPHAVAAALRQAQDEGGLACRRSGPSR